MQNQILQYGGQSQTTETACVLVRQRKFVSNGKDYFRNCLERNKFSNETAADLEAL